MAENVLSDLDPIKILDQAERDLVVARLGERGAPRNCDLCGVNQWVVGNGLVAPTPVRRTRNGVRLNLEDAIAVSALLHCKNCGNTKLLNINLLGLSSFVERQE